MRHAIAPVADHHKRALRGEIMKPNVGRIDSAIRVVAGLLLLSLLFVPGDSTRWVGLIGLIPLVTGLTQRCILYVPFGINTRGRKLVAGAHR